MQLRLIQAEIRMDPAAAEARVTSASGELAESLGELRELARDPSRGARVRAVHRARGARGPLAGADGGVVGRQRPPAAAWAGRMRREGSGCAASPDRVEAPGGHLLVTSPAGEGTLVTGELPLVASPVP
jgi:hypothetical protein